MDLVFSSFVTLPAGHGTSDLPSIRTVPFAQGRSPAGRFTGVFGFKDTLAALQEARLAALGAGQQVVRVDLTTSVSDVPISKQNLAALPELTFLHLPLIRIDLANHILDVLQLSGKPGGNAKDNLLRHLNENPDHLNNLWASRDFAHIKCIVWPCELASPRATSPGHRLCASVRSIVDIDKVVVWNYPDVTAHLEP